MIGLTTIKNEQLRPIRTAVGYFLLPVQTGVNRVGSAVYTNFKNQERMRTALSDNETLRKQVASLTMENTRLQSDSYELRRLRALYALNQTYGQYRMTGARVIAKDTGNWFHVFRIDKGARDGIKPDMNAPKMPSSPTASDKAADRNTTARMKINCITASEYRRRNQRVTRGITIIRPTQ